MISGRGLILAAPASGAGKTTVTLGLLRAFAQRGIAVRGAKSGPDYIDTRFHAAAARAECVNLDAWAMTPSRIKALAGESGLLLIEGAMGLFDGAPPDGRGATADLARILRLPVVLVVDAARMGHSVAALVSGFAGHAADVSTSGVILNNVGSDRHAAMLQGAVAQTGLPVLGVIHRTEGLSHPARHLGLVQAGERVDLDAWLDHVAGVMAGSVDVDALAALAAPLPGGAGPAGLQPPAQRIAIAQDRAFAFAYPHLLDDWRRAGAEFSFFSPLGDEAPAPCDLIYLPGGYPELHAGALANATRFRRAIADHAAGGGAVYGECGGYMVLGEGLIDAAGTRHRMLGLLALETSFAARRLHLGYRHATARAGAIFAGRFTGHEFHYATTLRADGPALFEATDATGAALPPAGLIAGPVSGSFLHLIDRTD